MIGTQFLLRTVTALGLVILLIITLTQGRMALLIGLLTITGLGLWEFYRLFWHGTEKICSRCIGLLCGLLLIYGASWQHPDAIVVCLLAITLLCAISFLVHWAKDPTASLANTGILVFGILYIPLFLLPIFTFTIIEIILVFLAAAASDVAAYIIGLLCGRHKIWPAVSPKKSVEGSIAGLLACMAAIGTMGVMHGYAPLYQFLILGFFLNIAAQLGDFFESAIKRANNIKDSGSILPGHGGVLDRIDSILFLVPTYAIAKNMTTFF